MENIQEKKQRTTDDIIVLLTIEENNFRSKFPIKEQTYVCTVCAKSTKDDAYPHPTLGVIICSDCLQKFSNSVFLINKDGTDKNCRWCGLQAKKYHCSTCTVVFCKNCLEQNFGSDFVRCHIVNDDNWKCLICEPKQLWRLRALCENAVNKDLSNQTMESLNVSLTSEKEHLPSSQIAEPYSEQKNGISSSESEFEIITTPKKVCKPITKYEESDSSPEFLIDEKLKLSQTFKELLEETREDVNQFIHMFQEDGALLFDKYLKRDINSYDQAEKIVNKISIFCDIAVKNINSMKDHSVSNFKDWTKVFKNSCFNTNSKAEQTKEVNDSKECTNSASNPSSKITPKYDKIDLSSTQTEIVHFLTNIRKSMSSDDVKPSASTIPTKPSTSADSLTETKENGVSETPENTTQTLKEIDNQSNNNEREDETVLEVEIKNEQNSEDMLDNFDKATVLAVEQLNIRIKEDFGEDILPVKMKIDPLSSKNNNQLSDSELTEDELLNQKDIKKEIKIEEENMNIEDSISSSNSTYVEEIKIKEEKMKIEDSSSDSTDVEEIKIKEEKMNIEDSSSDSTDVEEIKIKEEKMNIEDGSSNSIDVEEIKIKEEKMNIEDSSSNSTDVEEIKIKEEKMNIEDSSSNSTDVEENKIKEEKMNIENSSSNSTDVEEIEIKEGKMNIEGNSSNSTDVEEIKIKEEKMKIVESSSNNTYVEIISDEEYEREAAYQNLVDSDISELVTESDSADISYSSSTSLSDLEPKQKKLETLETGYIKELNLADEIEKLQKHSKVLCKISAKINDPKYFMKAIVPLEKKDFENGINSINNKSSRGSESNSDEDEVNRLINLNTLKKRSIVYSSDEDSETDNAKKHRRPKRKRPKKSSSLCSSNSSSINYDVDLDYSDLKTDSEIELDLLAGSKTFIPNDILSDSLSDTLVTDDDDEEEEGKKKKTEEGKKTPERKVDEDVINIDGESPELDDGKSKWRKDKLLTTSINYSDSDTTNDATANDILQKQEERYLQKANKPKTQRIVKSPSSVEDDGTITVSDDMSSDTTEIDTDSDIEIIETDQKVDSDEGSQGVVKKGRKNIKKVLTDSELQEETQKADKEEAERKERLTLKQRTLETVLSESQLSEEEVGLVLDVDEVLKQPTVKVHPSLIPRLKPHQHKGIKFMWDVCYESVKELQKNKGAGCILAHCMGLGKTMQVIVLAHTLLTHPVTNVKHILIVCPLSTVFNWRNEFEKTLEKCPMKINFLDIRSDCQRTYNHKTFVVKNWRKDGGVIIMGYESFQILVNEKKLSQISEDYKQQMLEALIDPGPDLVVCDEGHMLRNGKSVRFATLSKIKTLRRIILTGTPLQNNLVEYYHMVNFVKPHLLGTLKEFYNRFVNPISNGQYENSNDKDIHIMKKRSHVLHKKLETTVQRYEESELIPYLPKRFDYVLFVQLSPLQIDLYELYLKLLDSSTRKLFKNYHALQNIWTHPAILKMKFDKRKEPAKKEKRYDEYFVPALDPDSENYSPLETDWFKDHLPDDILNISYGVKMQILFSIIKECIALGDKLLIFSSSIDELDLIEYFLKQDAMASGKLWKKDLHYYRMDGTVTPEKRVKYCNEFNNDNNKLAKLFLVSHKVGGFGLNLTAANRVVIMDVSWNPAYDIQSVFRIYRFGQNKNCYIYRLVSMGTMEEIVYSRAVTKLAISCRVVDEHQIKRHFNSNDLQMMYTLNKDYSEEPQTPTLPSDRLLAKLWEIHKPKLYKFCDHKSLLENLTHEELNEEEMKLAWEEFRKEVEATKMMTETSSNALQPQNKINYNVPGSSTNTVPLAASDTNNPIIFTKKIPVIINSRFKTSNPLPTSQEMIERLKNYHLANKNPPSPVLMNISNPITNNIATYNNFNNSQSKIPTNTNKPNNVTIDFNPFTCKSNPKNLQDRTSTRLQSNNIQIIPNVEKTDFQINVSNLQKNNVSVFPAKKSTTE